MKELAFQLDRLAHSKPELRPHIREVYRALPTARRNKQANTKVEEVIMDGNIAGVAYDVSMVMNRRFREYNLDPYMGSLEFDRNEVEITVSAYFRGKEYDSAELQELADTIADDIERRGLRNVEGKGYHSEISENALMVFTQRI